MARESTQTKLSRVRPPRVHITYDVEIGDAIEMKELPFVLGILGDYAGHQENPLPKLKDRKFNTIDRDNFDDVMNSIKPRLALRVDNKLADDDTQLGLELNFHKMEDFSPANVARQVEPMRRLLEVRERLNELRNKLYGNEKLETALKEIIQNTEQLTKLAKETGVEGEHEKAKGKADTKAKGKKEKVESEE